MQESSYESAKANDLHQGVAAPRQQGRNDQTHGAAEPLVHIEHIEPQHKSGMLFCYSEWLCESSDNIHTSWYKGAGQGSSRWEQ
jgi:hypothetical protein